MPLSHRIGPDHRGGSDVNNEPSAHIRLWHERGQVWAAIWMRLALEPGRAAAGTAGARTPLTPALPKYRSAGLDAAETTLLRLL